MQSTSVPKGPWKKYARLADNVRVTARLVEWKGGKFLEVKEKRMGDFTCPNCSYLLSQQDTGAFPNFFIETQKFHQSHRPLDFDA